MQAPGPLLVEPAEEAQRRLRALRPRRPLNVKTSVEPTLPALIGPSTWAARGRSPGLLGRQRQPDALPVLGEVVLDVVPLIDEFHRGFSIMASMVTVAREPHGATSARRGRVC